MHEFARKVSIQGGFLIVVPVDLIPLWEKELQVHLENPPSVIVYHGHQSWYHSTAHTADELAAVDVVITSYETLRSYYEDAMAAAASHEDFFKTPVHARSPTMVIYWRGQILDEAHEIANDKTGVNKAVNRVRALMRLPLTGTPFLNDYTDIHSQLSLIKLAPCEDPELFASHFLLRPGARQCVYCMLSVELNGVLSLVLQSCSLQLDRGDDFDGGRVDSEIDVEYIRHDNDLESWERDAQVNVKQPWLGTYKPGKGEAAIAAKMFSSSSSSPEWRLCTPNVLMRVTRERNCQNRCSGVDGDACEYFLPGEIGPSRRTSAAMTS